MESPVYSLPGHGMSLCVADSTSHQLIKFLYDGGKLVERLIVVSEHNLEKFNRDYVYPLNDSLVVS